MFCTDREKLCHIVQNAPFEDALGNCRPTTVVYRGV